jgi:hypothetical protein
MVGRFSGSGEIASAFTGGVGVDWSGAEGGAGGLGSGSGGVATLAGAHGWEHSAGMHSHTIGAQPSPVLQPKLEFENAIAAHAATKMRIITITSTSCP